MEELPSQGRPSAAGLRAHFRVRATGPYPAFTAPGRQN